MSIIAFVHADCDSLHLGIYVGGGIGVILLVLVILIGMATIVMVIKKRKISSDITTTTTQLYEGIPMHTHAYIGVCMQAIIISLASHTWRKGVMQVSTYFSYSFKF